MEVDIAFISKIAQELYKVLLTDENETEWITDLQQTYEENPDSIDVNQVFSHIRVFLQGKGECTDLLNDFKELQDGETDNILNLLASMFYPAEEEEEAVDDLDDQPLIDSNEVSVPHQQIDPRFDRFNEAINKFSDIFGVSKDVSLLLLMHFHWNQNVLESKWLTDQQSIMKEMHLEHHNPSDPLSLHSIGKGFCDICVSEDVDIYELYCGHRMCLDCWKYDISMQLQTKYPECPLPLEDGSICNAMIMDHDIEQFVDPSLYQKYPEIRLRELLFSHPMICKCPCIHCNWVIYLDRPLACNVARCEFCKATRCVLEDHDAHAPLPDCRLIEDFCEKTAKRMHRLEIDQNKWFEREEALKLYRKAHLSEVQTVFNNEKKSLLKYQDDARKKEQEQINKTQDEIAAMERDIAMANEEILVKTNIEKGREFELRAIISHRMEKIKQLKEIIRILEKQNRTHEIDRKREVATFDEKVGFYNEAIRDTDRFQFFIFKFREKDELLVAEQNQVDSDEYIKKLSKKCPKCKTPIYRESGCNYMKCSQCNYEFCWICEGGWNGTHVDHFRCPKYSKQFEQADDDDDDPNRIKYDDYSVKTFYPYPMTSQMHAKLTQWNNLYSEHMAHKSKYAKLKDEIDRYYDVDPSTLDSIHKLSHNLPAALLSVLLEDNNDENARKRRLQILNTLLFARSVVMWGYPTIFYITNQAEQLMFELRLITLNDQIDSVISNIRIKSLKSSSDLDNQVLIIDKMINNIIGDAVNIIK